MPESASRGVGGGVLPGGCVSSVCVCVCVCVLPGGGIPACIEADPPVDRITDMSKNITLATTPLRPVINFRLTQCHSTCPRGSEEEDCESILRSFLSYSTYSPNAPWVFCLSFAEINDGNFECAL